MLIPICDEIRRRHMPAITFLMVVMHLALFVSALDGQWFTESARLNEVCFSSGVSHGALVYQEWLRYGTYWLLDKSWFAVLANLAILIIFGPSLENRAGRLLFLLIYVSSAIMGGIFHSLFSHHIFATVSTSGAIAGLLGAYAVQIDLQTRIRTVTMWYEHPISGTTLCFLWVFAQVLLANHVVCDSGVSSFAIVLGGFLNGVLVGYFTRELTPNVVINRSGLLEIVPRSVARNLKQQQHKQLSRQPAKFEHPEKACPYCDAENHAPIQENNGAFFYQCAAKSCRRLVFVPRRIAIRILQPRS